MDKLRNLLNLIKIKKIIMNLIKDNEDLTYDIFEIELNLEQLIKILVDKDVKSIFEKYLDSIIIFLDYLDLDKDKREKINNNKVGDVEVREKEYDFLEDGKKVKQKVKIYYYENLVYTRIDDENFVIILYAPHKDNFIKCIENLLNILKEGGEYKE
jgi:hypothetical protein